MPTLKQGDHVHDVHFGSGRVIYTKSDNALVEFAKTAPNQLLPGVWSVRTRRSEFRTIEGKRVRKRVDDHGSFGREDACQWYDRYKNNLEIVLFPDKIKRDKKQVVNQSISGNNNIQAAGNVVVQKA